MTIQDYLSSLRENKHVVVLGIGVSNRPLIRLLLENGICVTACDRMHREDLDEDVLALEAMGAQLKLGSGYLDGLAGDVVFRSPGIRPDIPALQELAAQGAELTSEMEVFFRVCPCPIIAVTGSDGKTTTTTLIAEMLRHAGHRVWLGGNIGTPLLAQTAEMKETDFAVVELSSFQLMTMKSSAHVAVVTNLAPNHLDVHRDMDEYVAAKENIYLHQKSGDRLVVNLDNDITASFIPRAKGTVEVFSRQTKPLNGAYLDGQTVFYRGEPLMTRQDILLLGIHNVENYMAAVCAVGDYVNREDILAVAREFGGVEHRMEFVREYRGIRIYNDSIASSPSRTMAGLHSFDRKVILIAGGYNKKIPFDSLGPEICDHVKTLVLCGATAARIEEAVRNAENYKEGYPEIITVDCLSDALQAALAHGSAGDIITLSPACAAFDQFRNFMERGKTFKQFVWDLE